MAGGVDVRGRLGSRRIFAPHFKLQVLDSYRTDADCRGNQRATARKYGIHRRQIQKWLQAELALRRAAARPASPLLPVDLSVKKKLGYEEAPPTPPPPPSPPTPPSHPSPSPPQQQCLYRLFRPFLPDHNFQEVDMSSLAPRPPS